MERVRCNSLNQMDDEKTRTQLGTIIEAGCGEDEIRIKKPDDSENDKIPEIVDIYDYIYGNVQNKLEFYERKISISSNRKASIDQEYIRSISGEFPTSPRIRSYSVSASPSEVFSSHKFNYQTNTIEEIADGDSNTLQEDAEVENNNTTATVTHCSECLKNSFAKDRTEILKELNTQLKVKLQAANDSLKKEITRSSDLNFEIANIENILETYYKETKNSKKHFSTLYEAMKDYVVESKVDYTYKRIKAIADYIDRLKCKLESQDKIIKNNFAGNPYSTDLMVKHASLRRQLDEMSTENEYLKEDIKNKAFEHVDIIKELNRQKFEVENRYAELDKQRKLELEAKDNLAMKVKIEHEQQMLELQSLLKKKENEMLEMRKNFEAKINNYEDEIAILYRKFKEKNDD